MVTYTVQKQNLKLIDTYTTQERKEVLGRSMEITTRGQEIYRFCRSSEYRTADTK